jgi:glycosyltransferase involved in cell wall biosynthesis
LGAREHYSIPVALHRSGCLGKLITDFWAGDSRFLANLSRSAKERTHPELRPADVTSFPWSLALFEGKARLSGQKGWDRIISRNEWFQNESLRVLRRSQRPASKPILFSYSYAARRLFEYAKGQGWATVLGQIDPGPVEEQIVLRLHKESKVRGLWSPAPGKYWQAWREECRLADVILVNSEWSRRALLQTGVPEDKIETVPLAYSPSPEALAFDRKYPPAFTRERPMRVLFLGQVNLRKGAHIIFEALDALKDSPIEFHFVGPVQVEIPSTLLRHQQIVWHGVAPRGSAAFYYQSADLFLLPTFSDGFALTQLEARSWKLPIVVSRYCGDVVRDGYNGRILDPLNAGQLAVILRELAAEPGKLASMAAGWDGGQFSIEVLASSLMRCKALAA